MTSTDTDISQTENLKKKASEKLTKDQQMLAFAMSEVMVAINSSLNLDIVLDKILENLGNVVPNKTSSILLIEGKATRVVRSKGYDILGTDKELISRDFEFEKFKKYDTMFTTKQPVLVYNPKLNQDWNALPESEWIKSHISAPIISENQVIGFINCDSEIEDYYDKSQLIEIQWFAAQAGLAIQNARRYNQSTDLSKKLRMINDLTNQVLNKKNLNDIFNLFPENLIALFGADNLYITSWNEESKTVSGYDATGSTEAAFLSFFSKPGDKTLTENALDSRQAVFIPDITQTAVLETDFCHFYSEKAILCLPIMTERKRFGAIMIGFKNPEVVNSDCISLAEYTAIQISTAIEKMDSLEFERKQSTQLAHANALIETLSRVSATIKKGVNLQALMETLGNELELLGIHSMVTLCQEPERLLGLTYISVESEMISFMKHFPGIKLQGVLTPKDITPLFVEVTQNQTPKFIDDPVEVLKQISMPIFFPFLRELLESLKITRLTKCILVPLVIDKKTIGILSLWGEGLQVVDIQAATIFGGQVGAAIENTNLFEEVQRLAVTDELTNVLNRRGFGEVAKREFDAAIRYKRPFSVIMLDIDRFKGVNDAYGHLIGDEILKDIANRCKMNLRDTDYISRFGGEEFTILLVEQDVKNARKVAERIRRDISAKPFHTSIGEVSISVSLGVTSLSQTTPSITEMIKEADMALYKSKEKGRNQVTVINE